MTNASWYVRLNGVVNAAHVQEFGRSLGTLEGRLAEHGGQADVAATVLAIAQERNISEKREIEVPCVFVRTSLPQT